MSDPLAFLAKSPEDWMIETAVVQKALDLMNERRKNEIEATGIAVANALGRIFR